MNKKFAFILALLTIGIASRFIPHYPNFTAIGSMALLGGAMLKKPIESLALPLLALILSDLVINNVIYPAAEFTLFYEGAFYVYGAVLLSVFVGRMITRLNAKNYVVISLVSSILFFLLTNFGVWQTGLLYSKTFSGLLACYGAALPYALSHFTGTLAYGVVIMLAYNALARQGKMQFQRV